MTEAEQILQARQGDVVAWEMVVHAHQQAVFRLAYLLLGDSDDAEDITQETFIRAYYALKRFDLERPIRPWLLRITANLAHNQRRALGRYLAFLRRVGRAGQEAVLPVRQENGRLMKEDDSRILWQAIRRLNTTDQEIIYLRYFLEMPEAEMATTLGVATGTVKSRLHRAISRLKKIVEEDFPILSEGYDR